MTERDTALDALRSEGLYVIEWTDAPGVVYPEHHHDSRDVIWVLEGAITVGTSGGERTLGPGDRIDLSPGQRHWARAGDAGVRYFAATSRRPG